MKIGLPGNALGRAEEKALVALALCGDDAAFSELVARESGNARGRRGRWREGLARNLILAENLSLLADDEGRVQLPLLTLANLAGFTGSKDAKKKRAERGIWSLI